MSERHACRVLGLSRSSVRYRGREADDGALKERLRQLAGERRRFGYRRLHILLRREGEAVNHKRVYRLYREEGLTVRRRGRKRVAREARLPVLRPQGRNQRWSLDFVSDALAWGRRIRLLCIIDTFTLEALAIEVDTSLPGTRVAQTLDLLVTSRGAPEEIMMDNGPELTSRALDQWASQRGVRLRFIDPGKRLRDECLNEHWFLSLLDARHIVEAWRIDYNQTRPHSSLGNLTPEQFRKNLQVQPTVAELVGLSL
jgi:putative transposase